MEKVNRINQYEVFGRDNLLVDPEGQAAPTDQSPVVIGPVADAAAVDEVGFACHVRILRRWERPRREGSATTPFIVVFRLCVALKPAHHPDSCL